MTHQTGRSQVFLVFFATFEDGCCKFTTKLL